MPPKVSAKAGAAIASTGEQKQPTLQEAHLFYTIIKSMKGKPEIDWAAVAIDAGFKNAETAKVRYGQIKRKLDLDNWTPVKPPAKNQNEDGGDAAPVTPTTSRSKKTAATPGTGAGVKKRATPAKRPTIPPGSRARKAKSLAIVKMEQDTDMINRMFEEDNEEDMEMPETPTKKKKGTGNRAARPEPVDNELAAAITDEFANFPAVMPDLVIQRQAVLVELDGVWTTTPSSAEVHTKWLSRLPAHIQSRFYSQANAVGDSSNAINDPAEDGNDAGNGTNPENITNAGNGTNLNNDTNIGNGANAGNGGNIGNTTAIGDAMVKAMANNAGSNSASTNFLYATGNANNITPAQLFGGNFTGTGHGISLPSFASAGMPLMMPMSMSMGNMSNIGMSNIGMGMGGTSMGDTDMGGTGMDGTGMAFAPALDNRIVCGRIEELNLRPVPMHPALAEQLEREQEERDRLALFGGGGPNDEDDF
ncbi:uncharacterized protein B0H64DRAFT_444564 [Chaetomium fimeti]|uniref:Myb-like DNA-binding domain-containing protein n=1 Tax=Chaetomium fimeti TaxID=1854472 RepID=A0AAE0HB72_9PEZI|nr:hypothetical protein B0H64DRAFT_444564 [Chaetomium fimeti]